MSRDGFKQLESVMKQSSGFSLIELMVALAAGLVVSGAAVAFLMSSFKSNGEYVQSTRLTQELRNSLDLVSRDLRRAGYDDDALKYLSTGAISPLAKMHLEDPATDDSCIIYAYDRDGGEAGQIDLDQGEVRAVRRRDRTFNGRTVGVIEYAESDDTGGGLRPTCAGASPVYTSYPPACNGASLWCALSDPATLSITSFSITNDGTTLGSGTEQMQIRSLDVSIQGQLAGSTEFTRGVSTRVRVRADCLDPTITNCNNSP